MAAQSNLGWHEVCTAGLPRAACKAMQARKRWLAPVLRCSFCKPDLREPPGTYSITDARLPCTHARILASAPAHGGNAKRFYHYRQGMSCLAPLLIAAYIVGGVTG